MTPTSNPQTGLPSLSLPQWLFDQIMGQIEPDLTSDSYPLLDERYKGESPEERESRMDRYRRAFDRYEEAIRQFGDAVFQYSRAAREESQRTRQASEAQEQEANLSLLETQIQQ